MRLIILIGFIVVSTAGFAGELTVTNNSKCHMKRQYTHNVGMSYFSFPEFIDAGASVKVRVEQKHGFFANGDDYKGYVEYLLDCGSDRKAIYTIEAVTQSIHGLEYVQIRHHISSPGVVVSIPHNTDVGYFDLGGQLSIKLMDVV